MLVITFNDTILFMISDTCITKYKIEQKIKHRVTEQRILDGGKKEIENIRLNSELRNFLLFFLNLE